MQELMQRLHSVSQLYGTFCLICCCSEVYFLTFYVVHLLTQMGRVAQSV